MIEVVVRNPATGLQLARIEIRNVKVNDDGTADYKVKYLTERGDAVGAHKRWLYSFPRKRYNALALLLQALNTLDESELELESEFDPDARPDVPADLVGGLEGTRVSVRGLFDRLHNHRPALRSGQPLEDGGDRGGEEVGTEDSR